MTVVAEAGDSEDSDEANKENNDPVTNMVEIMFERSPDYFEKSFVSLCSEKNPNSVLTFKMIWFWHLAYIHSHMMDFAVHLRTTIITFLHRVLEKVTRVNTKVNHYPVYLQLTLY